MKNLELAGRLIYALPLAMFGFFHFMAASTFNRLVPSFLPAPEFWVYLTWVALILAAISILIDLYARLATLLLGIMFVLLAFIIWFAGFLQGDTVATTNFLKDLALSGTAFYMSSRFKA